MLNERSKIHYILNNKLLKAYEIVVEHYFLFYIFYIVSQIVIKLQNPSLILLETICVE